MKLIAVGLMAVAVCVLSAGCAVCPGGATPYGNLVTCVSSPAQALAISTDASVSPSKRGTATAGAFLWMFAFGDASLDAAMADAGIKKVHHVDHQVVSVFMGLWVQDKTIVYGE